MENLPFSSNLAANIVVLVLSLLAVTFFTSSEAVLISANKIRLRRLAEDGNRAAQSVLRVVSQEERFFASVILGQNLFIIFASSIGTVFAVQAVGGAGGVVTATVIMTLLIVVFGEMTPKVLAVQAAESYAMLVARPLEWTMKALWPVLYVISLPPRLLGSLLRLRTRPKMPLVTQAELRMLVDVGQAEGIVATAEREMLHRVFRSADIQVREVMTPRPDIVTLERGATVGDFLDEYRTEAHSRYPVYDDSVDNIVGIVWVRDIIEALAHGELSRETRIADFIRPAYFVPETRRIIELFGEMRAAGALMAIVVDEFGGTAGMATLRRLAEEIVGRAGDELVALEAEFRRVDEHTFEVSGGMSVQRVNEELQLGLPSGQYETVAGFILSRLGYIPRTGDKLKYDALQFVVEKMEGLRIDKVVVKRQAHEG